MVRLGAGFLQDRAGRNVHDDRVRGENEGRLAGGFVVDFGLVDGLGLFCGGAEDVFEGGEGFGEVLVCVGRDDFDVGEAEVGDYLAAARGLRGEDYALGAQGVEDGEGEGWWAWERGAPGCCWFGPGKVVGWWGVNGFGVEEEVGCF